jgi:hypothetical protein
MSISSFARRLKRLEASLTPVGANVLTVRLTCAVTGDVFSESHLPLLKGPRHHGQRTSSSKGVTLVASAKAPSKA